MPKDVVDDLLEKAREEERESLTVKFTQKENELSDQLKAMTLKLDELKKSCMN